VGELDGVGVLPHWQGNGLHHDMLVWRIKAATALGRPDALATVSPDNLFSLPNMLAVGLTARALMQMPHGAWRYVMHHDGKRHSAVAGRWRPLTDVDGQIAAFASGARGVALRDGPDGPEMLFTGA
jgi:hypothetical protein